MYVDAARSLWEPRSSPLYTHVAFAPGRGRLTRPAGIATLRASSAADRLTDRQRVGSFSARIASGRCGAALGEFDVELAVHFTPEPQRAPKSDHKRATNRSGHRADASKLAAEWIYRTADVERQAGAI